MVKEREVDPSVAENVWLCAERGWRISFVLHSGETIEKAYITATDEKQGVCVIEKIGERDLPPRVLYLHDVKSVEPHWA